MSKRVFVSDCEGPISKNDNAFELTANFVPNGDKLFSIISRYDDILADIIKKPGYKAGDTLKLVLPFLKVYDVTDKNMEKFSSKNIRLVPGAKDTLNIINSLMPSFIVSTSYEQYIRSLCKEIDFPFENTYSTRLKIDDYKITENEKNKLKKTIEDVVKMPVMEISENNSFSDFSKEDKKNVKKLDYIFWKKIPQMSVGRILKEVNPIGGYEKANAVDDIVKKMKTKLSNVMYVGDSITDVEAFRLVREGGGLTVSFNGNNYAVREAEIGITAPNTGEINYLALIFNYGGKDRVIKEISEYPRIELITDENREEFSNYSNKFRKTVRGEAIGKLG